MNVTKKFSIAAIFCFCAALLPAPPAFSAERPDAGVKGPWLRISNFPEDAEVVHFEDDGEEVEYMRSLDGGNLLFNIYRFRFPGEPTPENEKRMADAIRESLGETVEESGGDRDGIIFDYEDEFTESFGYTCMSAIYEIDDGTDPRVFVELYVFAGDYTFLLQAAIARGVLDNYEDRAGDWFAHAEIVDGGAGGGAELASGGAGGEKEIRFGKIDFLDPGETTTEEAKKVFGKWRSVPKPDVKFNIYEEGGPGVIHGYIDIGPHQTRIDALIYDPKAGAYALVMTDETIASGHPNFPNDPPGGTPSERVRSRIDFSYVAGSVRFVPGKPEKLVLSFRVPFTRQFDLYYTVKGELVREEYVKSAGAAATKAAQPVSVKQEYPKPHWLTGKWKTLKGDGMLFSLSRNGMTAQWAPLDGTPYDWGHSYLLWDEGEKAWAMAVLESMGAGNDRIIEKIAGYVRPSSGKAHVPSKTIEVEVFKFPWNDKGTARAILEKYAEADKD